MKENKKIFKRKERGITLIALVITIIVLLILAGVSIAMLTGQNGILTQAQRAKKETENVARKEEESLAQLEAVIEGKDVPIVQVNDKNPGQLEQEGTDTLVINSIEDLVFFSSDVTNGNNYSGKTVKLGTNLDFSSDKSYVNPNRTDYAQYGYSEPLKQALTSGTGFIPIGSQDGINSFYGTFDGNGKAICSLYINMNSNEDVAVGLFARNYGVIQNLGLVNTNITVKGSNITVGGLIGISYNSIYSSYITGHIKATASSWTPVGGICGVLHGSSNIEKCYNLASIECENTKEEYGDANITCGGIVGQIEDEQVNINKCFNKGSINVDGEKNQAVTGGIVGSVNSINSEIKNSYNTSKIYGKSEADISVGGIIGRQASENNISFCYNQGEISGDAATLRIGGIVGIFDNNVEIKNVYNIGKIGIENTNQHSSVGGIAGVANEVVDGNITNAYNIGAIETSNKNSQYIGSIIGQPGLVTFNDCYYLTKTYDVGVGENGTVTGVTKLDSIDKFPSVIEVVNVDGTFEEDSGNVNNGYPVLKMD